MRETNAKVIKDMNEAMNLMADLQSRYMSSERTEIFKSCIKNNYENADSVIIEEFVSEMIIGQP